LPTALASNLDQKQRQAEAFQEEGAELERFDFELHGGGGATESGASEAA